MPWHLCYMKIALESPRHFRYLVITWESPVQCLVRLQINRSIISAWVSAKRYSETASRTPYSARLSECRRLHDSRGHDQSHLRLTDHITISPHYKRPQSTLLVIKGLSRRIKVGPSFNLKFRNRSMSKRELGLIVAVIHGQRSTRRA